MAPLACNAVLAVLALSATVVLQVSCAPLPTSHLLKTDARRRQSSSSEVAMTHQCRDPLRHLVPESTCPAGSSRDEALDAVYIMSEHDGCPARPVCLHDREITACHRQGHHIRGYLHSCPDWAPVPVLEYATVPGSNPEQDGANECPVLPQPRCVRLDCFDAFCRARSRLDRRRSELRHAGEDSREHRPVLEILEDGCSRLHCGCPATEAELFVEGCQGPGEHLILLADRRSGCPMKLCLPIVPHWVEKPQLPPSLSHERCPPQPDCPPGTGELTVASLDPERCPLRVCLLSDLLEESVATDSTLSAFTSSSPDNTEGLTTTTKTATNHGHATADGTAIISTPSSPPAFTTAFEATTKTAASASTPASTFDDSTTTTTTITTTTEPASSSAQEIRSSSDQSLRSSHTTDVSSTSEGGTTTTSASTVDTSETTLSSFAVTNAV